MKKITRLLGSLVIAVVVTFVCSFGGYLVFLGLRNLSVQGFFIATSCVFVVVITIFVYNGLTKQDEYRRRHNIN